MSLLAALVFAANLEAELHSKNIPGAAVVVVQGDHVLYSQGYGVANAETKTPVTTDTLFRLGSTTKMFVADAVLQLKLPLDKPIGEIVSDLPPPLRKLTLEQLLTHTAGLHDDAPMQGPLDESALHARVRAMGDDAFFTTPGEVMSYANPGYVIVGDVISATTGKPFSEAMDELVLRPNGMTHSTFRPLVAMTHPLAIGHDGMKVMRPFAEHAGNYPPGSLFTSADDVGKFLIALLNRDASLVERMASPRVKVSPQDRHYGYGLLVQDYRGTRLAVHTGARAGYGSIIMILPKERVAVAILANRTGAILSGTAFEIIDQFVSGPSPSPPPQDAVPISAEEIAQLTGLYVNSETIRTELANDGGKLVAKFAGQTLPVTKVGADRYRVAPGTQLESFVIVRDSSGTPRYLTTAVWALRKR
jgi:CubicO group peptidase (beta-lactamase class C family)